MPDNFRKEPLTFEVVGFRGVYHAILGRPCYAKFMAVPNYTYLKMKMPETKGVITVGSLLTDKRCIPLRFASVRTPHLFHHGIPKVLVNPRSKWITSIQSTSMH
jgi:hypothetical protein